MKSAAEKLGAVLGGAAAGIPAFLAGFNLPMILTPGSNLGPLTGFIIGPPAWLAGSVMGSKVAASKETHWIGFVLAAISGLLLAILLFSSESKKPDSGDGETYLGCALFIFGLTGLAGELARRLTTHRDP